MSTATALQPVRRRRLAAVVLATALAGGIGAALPTTEAQAMPREGTTCWFYGWFEEGGSWYKGWFEAPCG